MLAVVVAALVAGAGLQVASPLVVRAFLDLAQDGAAVERLVGVAALFIGVALVGSGLEIVRSHAGTVLAWQAMNNLRRTLFRHTVDLGHSFFARSTPGTLLERIDGDVAKLGRLLSDLLVELAANLLMTGASWSCCCSRIDASVSRWRRSRWWARWSWTASAPSACRASCAAGRQAPRSSGGSANGSRPWKSCGRWADSAMSVPASSGFWRGGCRARSPPRSPVTRCPWSTRCCSSVGWRWG